MAKKKRSCELKTALADASSIVQIGLIQEKKLPFREALQLQRHRY